MVVALNSLSVAVIVAAAVGCCFKAELFREARSLTGEGCSVVVAPVRPVRVKLVLSCFNYFIMLSLNSL